jgi:AGZA family xanthine/uracil permease-like MFS transporter
MTAMARQASLYSENERDFEGSSVGFLVDSACIAMSGLFFGCSPCTPFVGELRGRGTSFTSLTHRRKRKWYR